MALAPLMATLPPWMKVRASDFDLASPARQGVDQAAVGGIQRHARHAVLRQLFEVVSVRFSSSRRTGSR